jgi:ABC-2 type transport system permease protein
MNATVARLTARSLLGRRRAYLLMALPGVLIVLCVLVRLLAGEDNDITVGILGGFALSTLVPLLGLIAGTGSIGPEIDDGSIVYLIAKPVPRRSVVLSKYVVAWLATLALGALPLLVAGLVLDSSEPTQALAWALGGAVAGTTYTALFLALAALTRHAVVIGLLFVLLWEGLLGGLLSGIRWLAIGAWGQEIAASVSDAVKAPGTGLLYAVLAATVLTVGSVWLAGDRLRSFTLRGDE